MAEKKKSLYEITGDLKALETLLFSLEDEDGEPRAPSDEEKEVFQEWFAVSTEEFTVKFDNYCRLYKNLLVQSDIAKAEKDAYSKEG